ncbi:unnamed protein product [Vitrella brassicaformis CCMP3155]|uniref:Apple domain-containing protein n=2 Tax=Vitrella brassicaformis TaxID=1169539 RepID=A0A0G4FED4_VITBC|nr:unnamed protein product [Vitrella brassicaformis CCMP3155]|mmetsp:Transcript_42205/g.105386  ORF Transcript_42205/g.105386 Transcript_42205/m.105386 type:complete len:401 (+) Transcript_42205:248-1450(+)|eukprot:CEM11550.1 unnamed protein product [Vitrella brassicaformis CCMP3155]
MLTFLAALVLLVAAADAQVVLRRQADIGHKSRRLQLSSCWEWGVRQFEGDELHAPLAKQATSPSLCSMAARETPGASRWAWSPETGCVLMGWDLQLRDYPLRKAAMVSGTHDSYNCAQGAACWRWGIDYLGHDLPRKNGFHDLPHIQSAEACSKECESTSGCFHWSYGPEWGCSLKGKDAPRGARRQGERGCCKDKVSGPKPSQCTRQNTAPPFPVNKFCSPSFPGAREAARGIWSVLDFGLVADTTLVEFQVSGAGEYGSQGYYQCQAACHDDQRCKAFELRVYDPPYGDAQPPQCMLYDAPEYFTVCSTSFVQCSSFVMCRRSCHVLNKKCPGRQMHSRRQVDSADQCQNICKSTHGCVWFNHLPSGDCQLYSSVDQHFCTYHPAATAGKPRCSDNDL